MIALPRTRDFSAGNWQILLTNNNLNAVRSFMGRETNGYTASRFTQIEMHIVELLKKRNLYFWRIL